MPTTIDKAQVTLPSEREVQVTRSFRAPRALVYKAYTDPELVKRWSPYYAASNEPTRLRDSARGMTRGACGPVALSISRDPEPSDYYKGSPPGARLGCMPWPHSGDVRDPAPF